MNMGVIRDVPPPILLFIQQFFYSFISPVILNEFDPLSLFSAPY